MNEERLVDIESRIAFQEDTIKELNDVVIEQQKQIDRLHETCKRLIRQLKELTGAASQGNVNDEKPPHY